MATLVIGIGNDFRSDDAAGLIIARQLKTNIADNILVLEQLGDGTALMELWQEADDVILVDAVSSGAPSGTIHRFDAQAQPIPAKYFNHSTHAFGLAEAVELSRALNQLPRKLIIYGVEGRNFAPGTELSPEVAVAIKDVVKRILADLNSP